MSVLKQRWQWHMQTVWDLLRDTPWWAYVWPFGGMALILLVDITPFDWLLTKDVAELVSPILLAVALLGALAALPGEKRAYFKWLGFLGLALLLRELHFRGTDNGFYIAFLLLLWWASAYRERMQPFNHDGWVVGLFIGMTATYLLSKTFDRHYWDWAITESDLSDKLEETLEVLGHLTFLWLVVLSWRRKLRPV